MGYIGFHASIAGGVCNAVDEAVKKKAEAIQIFTANQRMWKTKPISGADAALFAEKRKKAGLKAVVAHDSYLINLASVKPDILDKSRKAFAGEIERSAALGIDAVIFHPGSYTGGTMKKGMKNIIDSLNMLMKKLPDDGPGILLETTAGAGSHIGGKFGELAEIISGIKRKNKTGVCFDTAHVFEAGYDIRNDYEGVFGEFERTLGTKQIKVFHLNDSRSPRESHVDRHEHIGKGELGMKFFEKLMKDKRFAKAPMIIETPDGENMDVKNMNLLKKFRGKS